MKRLTKDSIDRYVQDGLPVGDFLQAIITCDMRRAYMHADEENAADLYEIIGYFFNGVPVGAWGSAAIYREWIEAGGINGKMRGQISEGAQLSAEAIEALQTREDS